MLGWSGTDAAGRIPKVSSGAYALQPTLQPHGARLKHALARRRGRREAADDYTNEQALEILYSTEHFSYYTLDRIVILGISEEKRGGFTSIPGTAAWEPPSSFSHLILRQVAA